MSFSNLANCVIQSGGGEVSASPDGLQPICKGIKGPHVTWEFLSARESLSSDLFHYLTV